LLCRQKPPAPWITQQFDEWKVKEPARLEAYITEQGYGAAYRASVMKVFQDKVDFYTKDGATIQEKIRELELRGDTEPAALQEIVDRCIHKHPEMPMTCLRALIKLREWYPELPAVKSGDIQMTLVRHLANSFIMYREAAREAEILIQKQPDCAEVKSGSPLYYAAEYSYQHAEHLAPDPSSGWLPVDRTRPVFREAREYWERARTMFQRLEKEYPKHSACIVDPDTGHSDAAVRVLRISRPDRLGPEKKP
jgi:hypothetical protein